MRTVYLIRHGETEWNRERRIQGRRDTGLSPLGLIQAQQLAERFGEVEFDRVYCSPQLRAKQTAEIIVAGRAIPIAFDEALSERSLGKWEGLLVADVDSHFPEERNDPWYAPRDGESMVEVWDRSYAAWERVACGESGTTLVISHTYVLLAMLGMVTGLLRETPLTGYRFGLVPASVSIFHVSVGQDPQDPPQSKVVLVNDVSHLKVS